MKQAIEVLGRAAYDAYVLAMGGREPSPTWLELAERERDIWRAVGGAVLRKLETAVQATLGSYGATQELARDAKAAP